MFRTIFTTLRALLKSGLCATQLCIRSDTASYVNVQKKRIGNVRSSDRKFKLMNDIEKQRECPPPLQRHFARFSVADPLLLPRQEVARPPRGAFESCRSLGRDPRRHARSFSPLGEPRPALPGLKDRKTRLAAPPKRSWQWRKDEERGWWWQGGGGGGPGRLS